MRYYFVSLRFLFFSFSPPSRLFFHAAAGHTSRFQSPSSLPSMVIRHICASAASSFAHRTVWSSNATSFFSHPPSFIGEHESPQHTTSVQLSHERLPSGHYTATQRSLLAEYFFQPPEEGAYWHGARLTVTLPSFRLSPAQHRQVVAHCSSILFGHHWSHTSTRHSALPPLTAWPCQFHTIVIHPRTIISPLQGGGGGGAVWRPGSAWYAHPTTVGPWSPPPPLPQWGGIMVLLMVRITTISSVNRHCPRLI